MSDPDPALNVSCPTCFARKGEPCKSYRDISVHQGRRRALGDLDAEAKRLLAVSRKTVRTLTAQEIEDARSPAGGWTAATLASWGVPWPPPKGWRQRLLKPGDGPPRPVLFGETGSESAIPETAEYWPPWEHPPVPGCMAESGITVTGLLWCPVHQEYEELCDGVPAVRLDGLTTTMEAS